MVDSHSNCEFKIGRYESFCAVYCKLIELFLDVDVDNHNALDTAYELWATKTRYIGVGAMLGELMSYHLI